MLPHRLNVNRPIVPMGFLIKSSRTINQEDQANFIKIRYSQGKLSACQIPLASRWSAIAQ